MSTIFASSSDGAAPPKIALRIDRHAFPLRDAPGEEFVAMSGVAIDVPAGEFLTIVGPSGCGKTTLLEILAGLATPTAGSLRIDGREVTGPSLSRGIVFQQYALLPWRTAQANVEFTLEAAGGLSRHERRDKARAALELVGLKGFEDRFPHELSGGMKQRVAIARSLVYEPDILLMDEPFGALDAQTRELLQQELLALWQRSRTTVVFITHSIDEAVYLGQRVAVMTSRPGRIKAMVDVDLPRADLDADIRSHPDFARYRHEVWELMRGEVARPRASTSPTFWSDPTPPRQRSQAASSN
ncbi:NitT/TauT family transport system ATP-binding protein [Ancylobacter sp. 3268]|uniref:ABC transporter ATP-binding protein n=1 Tax=Ancylobacter sp. 3268 TaxID=2817752 RepID=UPI0028605B00|nr:ABC transporter ATP-binding protein [Ancylobacter sp. 3268]MDR6953398.1 NitT/TauT family transport system ATP-binding protein [Ancylobacter sp. 3268]